MVSLLFESVTYARLAQGTLWKAGIRSRLTHKTLRSCRFGLDVGEGDREKAEAILRREGIRYESADRAGDA